MHNILNLPCDIYSKIQEYTNINTLLNSSKKLNDVKYKLYYWKLTVNSSVKYYEDIKFKDKIDSKMHKTCRQLFIKLCSTNVKDVSMLGHVHALDLCNAYDVEDVSALGNVYKLELNCTRVKDVSKLINVHTLFLESTPVTDVSALKNAYKLDLSCTNVSDASALGNVHTLYLDHTKVINVSNLGNVSLLDLCYTDVRDVSMLCNVKKLRLCRCKHVKNKDMLNNLCDDIEKFKYE